MTNPSTTTKTSRFWRSGLMTAGYLGFSVPVLFVSVFALAEAVPMSHAMETIGPVLMLIVVLGGLGVAGALWGRLLARQAGLPNARRMAWVGGLIFAPLTLATMQALGTAERVFVEGRLARTIPVHVSFAILFTLAAFVVTAGLAFGVGWAARGWRFGLRLALQAGLAAALAFLLADVAQDLLGRRVGGPDAARTATMLTVAFLGNIVAAFVGGGVMGVRLGAEPERVTARTTADGMDRKAGLVG